MIDVFLQKEAEHKAAAERAAKAGDWGEVLREAESLVKVYGAILVSGMVAADTLPRWRGLREKWREIAAQAGERSRAGRPKGRWQTDVGPTPGARSDVGKGQGGGQDPEKPARALKLDDVKGLDEAKQIVLDALVNPVKHPDIYKALKIKSGKGLLLYGPPGTGKTMFARAIAGEMGLPFIYKKISELKDKYVGESEKGIARLFEEAYSHSQSVVFLDECEGLLRRRGNQPECVRSISSLFPWCM